ncbi:MAG TPA: ABC transporter ATP-binding protein [Clostridiaceae bacterium]|nr:ABC transporter ATP-binding protein [Clostridiaceae bacterium]
MIDNSILSLKDVSVQYENGTWGIKNITLDFHSGKVIGLIGSNGAGKSTLMNALVGIQSVTNGEVILNLRDIDRKRPFASYGWSPQRQAIDWYLNVFDNVVFGPLLAGYSLKDSKSLAEKALKLVGLFEQREKMADSLSGGQQQRIQVARALAHNPNIYILDEPTTGLDAESTEVLMKYLSEKSEEGCLVIISSHDLYSIEKYCDIILFLNNGEVEYYEKKEDFLNRFSSFDVIEITTDTPSDDIDLDSLNLDYRIQGDSTIVIKLSPTENINDMLTQISNRINIISMNRKNPSLKDIYLSIKGGVNND